MRRRACRARQSCITGLACQSGVKCLDVPCLPSYSLKPLRQDRVRARHHLASQSFHLLFPGEEASVLALQIPVAVAFKALKHTSCLWGLAFIRSEEAVVPKETQLLWKGSAIPRYGVRSASVLLLGQTPMVYPVVDQLSK